MKPSLGAIFLTIFLDLVGFGIVLPFLAEEARDTFHSTALVATLLSAVYSLMQFLFVPVWGRLSDRIGRKPVLVWSIAATSLAQAGLGVGLAYGGGIGWLYVARIFAGIATANLGTASAYIADVTPPAERAKGMGLIGAAFGLGFIFGPGIGGVLAAITVNGRHGPVACYAAAALSVVNLVWVIFGLSESLPKEKRSVETKRISPLDIGAVRIALSDTMIARAVFVNFVSVVSFANFDQTFRFFNKDVFAMGTAETGVLLAVIGLAAAGVQGGIVRQLSGRVSDTSMLRAGLALQVVSFVGIAASATLGRAILYSSSVLLAIGNGLSQPSVSAFVSKRAKPTEQGATLGANQSAASLARMVGPALGGWLYGSVFGLRAPYIAAALGMMLALLLALVLRETQSTSTQTS